jgi:TniQ
METFISVDKEIHSVSCYYNLEPIGLGSPFVESLTSYLTRLSEVHNVSLGNLIGKELTPLINKHYLKNVAYRGGAGIYKSGTTINGIGLTSHEMVSLLQQLTHRKDLFLLTLITYSEVLTTRRLLKSHKHWCPICLEEWRNNKIDYEPLLWFFQEVKICHVHNIKLHSHCPNCDKEIPTLSRNSRVAHCSNCSFWLGQNKLEIPLLNREQDPWEHWKTLNICKFLEAMPLITTIDRNHVKTNLLKIFKDINNGSYSNTLNLMRIPKSTLNSWLYDNKLPTLSSLLKISYCSGVSLKKLLTEDLSGIEYDVKVFPFKQDDGKINSRKFPSGFIEQQLEYWANGDFATPPSVKQIAEMIGCDRKLLYQKGPKYCELISKKHKNYIDVCSDKRIEKNKNEVIKAVNILINKGIYPSRRKVEKLLEKPGLIKERGIREVWNFELKKLGLLKEI